MRESVRKLQFYLGVVAGDCLVIAMFIMLSIQPPVLAVTEVPVAPSKEVKQPTVGEPTRLTINRMNLTWPVSRGYFDPNTDSWTDSEEQVIFADKSVQANDSNGITLLYGHARATVFMNLTQLQPGDIATLSTSNGHNFTYRFAASTEVIPSDIGVFTEYGSPKLVLQTCSGPWDAYRSLYYFDYESVVPV